MSKAFYHLPCEIRIDKLVSAGITIRGALIDKLGQEFGIPSDKVRRLVARRLEAQETTIRRKIDRQNRRAASKGAIGTITYEEWIALCEKHQNKCLCCGNKWSLNIDHVKPLSVGGTNTMDNIQPLCCHCNSQKGNKYIDYRPHE